MFDLPPELEPFFNIVFLVVTAVITWHGIRYRDENGEADYVRLLFGCLAAVFFLKVLLEDMLGYSLL